MYRAAELRLVEFLYCVIEPPVAPYDCHEEKPLWVDAGAGEPALRSTATKLPGPPEGAFTHSLVFCS